MRWVLHYLNFSHSLTNRTLCNFPQVLLWECVPLQGWHDFLDLKRWLELRSSSGCVVDFHLRPSLILVDLNLREQCLLSRKLQGFIQVEELRRLHGAHVLVLSRLLQQRWRAHLRVIEEMSIIIYVAHNIRIVGSQRASFS